MYWIITFTLTTFIFYFVSFFFSIFYTPEKELKMKILNFIFKGMFGNHISIVFVRKILGILLFSA